MFSPLLNYELLYADFSVNDSTHWLEEVNLAVKLASSLPLQIQRNTLLYMK